MQSDVGYGSGVAVQTNVVLTAAHLVFDDQTLSYVSQVYWYYQEEVGSFVPDPLPARGWYVLSDYAEQRTNDVLGGLGPDQSSPQSRNQDVAALYFLSPMANGGYGGYLPSDAVPNTWLTSTANKMLVGYPVDGSIFGNATIVPGEMYEIGPQPYPLSLATDIVTNQQEVYTASWFLSYPGNSGGPLYVEYNSYYYPAGVYLGSLSSGVVPYASAIRAIDSNVVNLINFASTNGSGSGSNSTGGGVITVIANAGISPANPAILEVPLGPPAAVLAGAGWQLSGDPANAFNTISNAVEFVTTTNNVSIVFKPIPGWNIPTNNITLQVTPNPYAPTVISNVLYSVKPPTLVLDPVRGLGLSGTTNTSYVLQSRSSLTSGIWSNVSTNLIVTNGFNAAIPKPGTNQATTFYRAVWLP